MRKYLPLLVGSLALVAGSAQAVPIDREAELARAVQGRVAGEPVDCIDMHRVQSSRIIPGTAIVYDTGGVIYVNRPRAGAESLTQWDIQVNRLWSSQLCSIDTVQLLDQGSHSYSGTVFLGEFIPYRRVRTSDAR
ncbi:MAG: hypothetical protein QOG13_65 [Sphingomonadales bacterium]|jgi:hypothetical protein|nr:hypothetical protein [Sphingomonadales bacterium]